VRPDFLQTEISVPVLADWVEGHEDIVEWLGTHTVDIALRCRWQYWERENEGGAGWNLLDWAVIGLLVDGHAILPGAELPGHLQHIVNAAHSRKCREEAERQRPTHRLKLQ